MWTDAGGKEFEQAPTGTELGICIKVIDLGTQEGEYQGKINHKQKVVITWELPNALMSEGEYAGKPFIVNKYYTASLNEKASLRHDLTNWRGRDFTDEELAGFDPKNIIGKPCMLSLVKNDKGKTVVSAVMAVMKGMPIPKQVNQSVYFSMYPGRYDQVVFESLSDFHKELIQKSPEYQKLMRPVQMKDQESPSISGFEDFENDIPFRDFLGEVYWRVV